MTTQIRVVNLATHRTVKVSTLDLAPPGVVLPVAPADIVQPGAELDIWINSGRGVRVDEGDEASSPATFGIGRALDAMEHGYRVARVGWNGKGQSLELQRPDANSKMTLPYVFIRTAQGALVPWLCSQTDLLARDWSICTEPLSTPG